MLGNELIYVYVNETVRLYVRVCVCVKAPPHLQRCRSPAAASAPRLDAA